MATWARKEDCPYHWSTQTSEEYVFQQVHFHWGEDDQSGSEHTLNNERRVQFLAPMRVGEKNLQTVVIFLFGSRKGSVAGCKQSSRVAHKRKISRPVQILNESASWYLK